jgi:exonuclease SbcC
MIPVNLKLRNFMPYRGEIPAFSFKGIHTACICGDNGNGKSAIIDAITWSLWGKSRAKSDDDLITLGEKDMEVEFEFYVGKQLYRTIRKLSRPKGSKASSQSSLDLFIANNGNYITITGNTKIHTQQNLISLLNMDYETFVNSAFLRQGNANEFTKQPPAKRKEVLANILGLSLYDQLEAKARDRFRYQQMKKTQIENTIQEIEQNLSSKPELEAELIRVETELNQLGLEIKKQQTECNRLRQQKDSLELKNQQLTQLIEHRGKTQDDIELWAKRIEKHKINIKEYQGLLDQQSLIEVGYSKYLQAKEINDEMNQGLQKFTKIKDKINKLEQVIQKAQSDLSSKYAIIQNKINQLKGSLTKLTLLLEEGSESENEKLLLTQLEETLYSKKRHIKKLEMRFHEVKHKQQNIEQDIINFSDKLLLLETQESTRCPLCETEIGKEALAIIKKKYLAEKEKGIKILSSFTAKSAEISADLKRMESAQNEIEKKYILLKASIQSKEGVVNKSKKESEGILKQLDEENKQLMITKNKLINKDFAIQEQAIFKNLENELAILGYDSVMHQHSSRNLAKFEKYQHSKQRLDEATKMLKLRQEELNNANEVIQELNLRLKIDTQKIDKLNSEINILPQLGSDLKHAEMECQLISNRQQTAQELKGSLQGKLEHISRLGIKQQVMKKQLKNTLKEAGVYLDLSQAFGKKGIQAMLIEMVLPDIEMETNKLLSRMTDNRMHAKIETQRKSKKGELIETLDIVISDELGQRPYENYSGGEAFRIDFAIRIALSRLLAKRAGAPIPTLIIDEGFGTQDSTNLEKIKEAINSIQDDFTKILIITHIEELKNAFPTRINVVKTAAGSKIVLS